jgi:tripartite-type tricarboxylate transporter receptor subunit TctC
MRRIESIPDVPTLNESGVRGYDFSSWIGLLGPANLPRGIVTKLHGETTKAITDPALKKKLLDLGLEIRGGTPEQFATFIKQDIATTAKIIRAANVQPE